MNTVSATLIRWHTQLWTPPTMASRRTESGSLLQTPPPSDSCASNLYSASPSPTRLQLRGLLSPRRTSRAIRATGTALHASGAYNSKHIPSRLPIHTPGVDRMARPSGASHRRNAPSSRVSQATGGCPPAHASASAHANRPIPLPIRPTHQPNRWRSATEAHPHCEHCQVQVIEATRRAFGDCYLQDDQFRVGSRFQLQ